jgi:hypothetical protein
VLDGEAEVVVTPPINFTIMWNVGKESGLVCFVTFASHGWWKGYLPPGKKLISTFYDKSFIIYKRFGFEILTFISIACP